jgi:hypothetical protein
VVPLNTYLFDNERLRWCENQSYPPFLPVPARDSLCPILLRCSVLARTHDQAAKQLARVEAQRVRREEERAAGVVRLRTKPTRFDDSLPGLAFSQGLAPARVIWPQQELAAGLVALGYKPSRRAKKVAVSSDELNVHNKEITPPLSEQDQRHVKGRVKSLNTALFLEERGNLEPNIQNALFKASGKIKNCNVVGLYQSISTETNYRVGSALCKNRLCPNCQRILAGKRRANFLDWFDLNRDKLRKYFFYHMVLTVRHSTAAGVRTGLYTPDMLSYFAELRGTSDTLAGAERRRLSKTWKDYVAGGSYGVELKAGRDKSPHIHIHVFLIGNRRLANKAKDSAFLAHVRKEWKAITGDSDGVFIKPVYYLDEHKNEVPCERGSDVHVDRAAMECMKYTIKADSEALVGYSNSFLVSLLTMRNRYYSRFGCLSGNDKSSAQFSQLDMLSADYQDLDRLTRLELNRLFDPTTGELVDKEDTSLLVAPHKNLKATPGALRIHDADGNVLDVPRGESFLGGETVYELLPSSPGQNQFFPYHERARAGMLLARSINRDYEPGLEPAGVLVTTVKPKPRRKVVVVQSPLSFCRLRWFGFVVRKCAARVQVAQADVCKQNVHGIGDIRPRRAAKQRLLWK